MEIDRTKSPGGQAPFADAPAETSLEQKRDAKFSEVRDKLSASEPAPATRGQFVVGRLRRNELDDPVTFESVVRASVSELVDSAPYSGKLSASQKESLIGFLAEDPLVRRQIESYLRKVLS